MDEAEKKIKIIISRSTLANELRHSGLQRVLHTWRAFAHETRRVSLSDI